MTKKSIGILKSVNCVVRIIPQYIYLGLSFSQLIYYYSRFHIKVLNNFMYI